MPSYSKGKSQQQGLGTTFLLVTGSGAAGQCHSQQDGLTLGKMSVWIEDGARVCSVLTF